VQTARLAAVQKGVAHELAQLEFRQPSHASLHPFLKMPVLRHEDTVLFETAAIAVYLDEAFDGPPLQPSDPGARSRMWQMISAVNAYGYPALVADTLGDDGIGGTDPQKVGRFLAFLDVAAGDGTLAAKQPDLASLFALPVVRHYEAMAAKAADYARHKRLAKWFGDIQECAAAQTIYGG
jgi:glutathione S-transferase